MIESSGVRDGLARLAPRGPLAQGLDGGTQIVGIGTATSNIRTIAAIVASEGTAGITNALGPSDPGVTRVLRIVDAGGGTREVNIPAGPCGIPGTARAYSIKTICATWQSA